MNALGPEFTLRLEMLSDWHIGTGAGRPGNVDRLVARDADGLPYVPAKTLTGIWRDACELVARGLDGGTDGAWGRLVEVVFGSQPSLQVQPSARAPLPARLRIAPAELAGVPRKTLSEPGPLRDALTFVKPGVAIDERTGRAKEDHLRFEEMARVGAVLEAQAELDTCALGGLVEATSALLLAGARMVERIGGNRRRGAGRCRLEVVGEADTAAAVEWLRGHHEELPTLLAFHECERPSRAEVAATSAMVPGAGGSEWLRVSLTLRLRTPVRAHSRTVGNVVESLDFLPGTYLLPHVTRALQEMELDPRRAIAAGDLMVLPATPDVEGHRGRPAPMSLHLPKTPSDANPHALNGFADCLDRQPQAKPCRSGYVGQWSGLAAPSPHRPTMVSTTHNTIDDLAQRPTEAVGGVYTYEAIAAGTVLRSELRIRKDHATTLPQNWWTSLSGPVRLGRSRKDDYGCVEITTSPPETPNCNPAATNTNLTVWLLSDVLLRSHTLRPEPTIRALAAELARALDVELTPERWFADTRRIESWHVGWGLPRPSLVALKAGTCVRFTLAQPLDPGVLARVECEGIGERRGEGYGQVCFNDPLVTESLAVLDRAETGAGAGGSSSGGQDTPDTEYARILESEAWRKEMRLSALAIASDPARREELLGFHGQTPPNSQLGALRNVLARVRSRDDRSIALDWLRHLEEVRKRKDKWNVALSKVPELIKTDEPIWKCYEAESWPVLTACGAERLKNELWAEAVFTLVDACIRAHVRDAEAADRGG